MTDATPSHISAASVDDILGMAFAVIDPDQPAPVLLENTQDIVSSLLKRRSDTPHRERILAEVSHYFVALMSIPGLTDQLCAQKFRVFAHEIIRLVVTERSQWGAPNPSESPGRRQSDNNFSADPPPAPPPVIDAGRINEITPAGVEAEKQINLLDHGLTASDVENPTAIHIVAPPLPERYDSFRELFAATLNWRLASVMRFFQRANSQVHRNLVRPFLLSSEFESKLLAVIDTIIVPKMYNASRSIALLETSRQWSIVSTQEFWDLLDQNPKIRASITVAWGVAWSDCKQHSTPRKGADGAITQVLVAQPVLLKIRDALAPARPESYDLPPVRNNEIDLFISLLHEFDLVRLEQSWAKLRQIYEQEMDRRCYQDKARQGALRDSLLEAFDSLPDRSGDFLALLCYFCFPHIDLLFLEKFTHNKGPKREQRIARLPYIMRFLDGQGVAEESLKEQRERAEREAAAEAERKAARQQGLG